MSLGDDQSNSVVGSPSGSRPVEVSSPVGHASTANSVASGLPPRSGVVVASRGQGPSRSAMAAASKLTALAAAPSSGALPEPEIGGGIATAPRRASLEADASTGQDKSEGREVDPITSNTSTVMAAAGAAATASAKAVLQAHPGAEPSVAGSDDMQQVLRSPFGSMRGRTVAKWTVDAGRADWTSGVPDAASHTRADGWRRTSSASAAVTGGPKGDDPDAPPVIDTGQRTASGYAAVGTARSSASVVRESEFDDGDVLPQSAPGLGTPSIPLVVVAASPAQRNRRHGGHTPSVAGSSGGGSGSGGSIGGGHLRGGPLGASPLTRGSEHASSRGSSSSSSSSGRLLSSQLAASLTTDTAGVTAASVTPVLPTYLAPLDPTASADAHDSPQCTPTGPNGRRPASPRPFVASDDPEDDAGSVRLSMETLASPFGSVRVLRPHVAGTPLAGLSASPPQSTHPSPPQSTSDSRMRLHSSPDGSETRITRTGSSGPIPRQQLANAMSDLASPILPSRPPVPSRVASVAGSSTWLDGDQTERNESDSDNEDDGLPGEDQYDVDIDGRSSEIDLRSREGSVGAAGMDDSLGALHSSQRQRSASLRKGSAPRSAGEWNRGAHDATDDDDLDDPPGVQHRSASKG